MTRPYRGVEGSARVATRRTQFLQAGLELLGGPQAPDELTVRAVCAGAGLSARYFYESFTDKDQFVAAVFDSVTATLAATTQSAVAAAAPAAKNRAGIANIVAIIADDARIGRLLFSTQLSNAVVLRKRTEQGGVFAMLSRAHIEQTLHVIGNDRIGAIAHFVVGGVAQTLSAWLAGEVALSRTELIDQLTDMLDRFNSPQLFRD